MSTLGPPSQDTSASKSRKGSNSLSTRKAPPSPLAISSSVSTHSRLQPPDINTNVSPAASSSNTPSSSNNTGRNSLESSKSDLASVRSEITSLRVSEFPLPPSALPTIPASPRTPRSIHFSTTPRSQSPNTGFAYQQQQHSPRSPAQSERVGAGSPVTAPHGYDLSQDPGPARYSQYAVYKESNNGASASRPATPTTAGTITSRDWPTSSEQRSSLRPPRPAYTTIDTPPLRSSSPLRNASFATQQDDRRHFRNSVESRSDSLPYNPGSESPKPLRAASPQPPRSSSPQPPRSSSPQPPRSPLPVPPRTRDSTRYSHIARTAGVTDMGLDISEEDLLSTDFISEMLNQPAVSSPRSARFLRLPDSPHSVSFVRNAPDETALSGIVGANEIRLAQGGQSTLDSPGFSAPKSVSASDVGLVSPARHSVDTPGKHVSGMESPGLSPLDGSDWQRRTTRRMQSGLASSIFPSGGDRIDQAQPSTSLPLSPHTQTLAVSDHKARNHTSPHPLMPSTPLSPESFSNAASPRSPHGFVQAQTTQSPGGHWRNTSTSQSLATHLPIGGKPSSNATQGAVSPRIRQHHYPRYGAPKRDVASKGQAHDGTPLQSMTYPPHPVNLVQPPTSSTDKTQNASKSDVVPTQTGTTVESPSAISFSSSTRTQRDSMPTSSRTVGTLLASTGSSEGIIEEPLPVTTTNPRHSVESSYLSTEHGVDDDDTTSYEVEGEIQTASRVWGATSPVGMRTADETRPTIIGIAPAVILNHNSAEPREAASTEDSHTGLRNVERGPFDSYAELTPPASPRDPPSIHSPPAHRTDMPESVKSVGLSEDVHGAKNTEESHYDEEESYRLPYHEIAYGAYQMPLPTSRTPTQLSRHPSNRETSFKSVVSYITSKSRASVSKVSNKSTYSSRWAWLMRKPLPPLPPGAQSEEPQDVSDAMRRHEAKLQRSDLAQRAGNLRVMLNQESYTRASKVSLPQPGAPQGWSDHAVPEKTDGSWHEAPQPVGLTFATSGAKFEMLAEDSLKVAKNIENNRRSKPTGSHSPSSKDFSTFPSHGPPFSARHVLRRAARKRIWLLLAAVLFVALILGVSLGTTLGHKHGSGTTTSCGANTAGARCNLDSTCICPSSQSGTCSAPLAKALAQVVPVTSQLFATNITTDAMAIVLWEASGTPVGQNCASQANLVDVGSVLDTATSPNRTHWAQAALLWSLFQTGDISATQDLQSAIKKLPFQSLQKDGPQADSSNKFSVTSSGYIFNFASQTVEAPSLKFQGDASPSSAQLGQLNNVAQSSLDRMYSFASASSTQRQAALSTYWESVLSLDRNDLQAFLSAFKSSPILLPFDATASPGGHAISDLLTAATNKTLSFPPSVGCFPGLSTSQVQSISAVETQVFGLSALSSSQSNFDSSCFAARPVYGVLDVLRTRLPFSDSRSGVAKQAAILTSDASSRVVLRVGELLSALPAANSTQLSPFSLDPRQFGTLSHVNHIALAWLQAFPSTTSAADAAKFVLSLPTSPPSSDSTLFNSTSIPVVETAVFGTIFLSDVAAFASSFSTPSGALFFGSPQGDAFRHWALQQSSQATITWSAADFAAKTVSEGASPDGNFERIWSAASSLISNAPNGITGPSDVARVIAAFFGP